MVSVLDLYHFMKKVRFETPTRSIFTRMEDRECHSPRPFMQRTIEPSYVPILDPCEKLLSYFDDPVERYETSDSSPYPTANKTQLPAAKEPTWSPSNELDLSFLDASSQEPRQPIHRPIDITTNQIQFYNGPIRCVADSNNPALVLANISNGKPQIPNNSPPNVISKDSSFFIRRDNLDKYYMSSDPLPNHFSNLKLGKENNPATRKADMMRPQMSPIVKQKITSPTINLNDSPCRCHHCVRSPENTCKIQIPSKVRNPCDRDKNAYNMKQQTFNFQDLDCHHCTPVPVVNQCKCGYQETPSPQTENAVDKKTWAIQKFEKPKSKSPKYLEVSKQTNVTREKREPTVADLFKIIKLQNEQLQLLQEKVDKFITASTNNVVSHNVQSVPVQNYVTEHVALQSIDQEQHKISIGVMTSFEMVHTSTVINKEILTQTTENAQIQCNRSEISIKEVVTKPGNFNFLEGIYTTNIPNTKTDNAHETCEPRPIENVNDEKTLNEMSLYNVQVDNTTTPLVSPDQTMYLDVRDYSGSESSSDTSPVGWTYYNKVMTHVNGMMQESEMPSSASAMYRNTRHKFMQMQIDKTNVSITKRVKFGDDIGIHQPNMYTSDTSLKMNQLAAKYLNMAPAQPPRPVAPPRPVRQPHVTAPIDMSIATRNYMERHKLLKGEATAVTPTPVVQTGEMPRFLDITALKQQTKLL